MNSAEKVNMGISGKSINLNPDSDSFANVAETERDALSEAFGIFDLHTDTLCVTSPSLGDGKVTQDEFFRITGMTETSFAQRGFSAATNQDFARFRDEFDYLPDFKTGEFVKVSDGDNAATLKNPDLAAKGSEDVWDAFDKIWKEWEPIWGRAEKIYDRSSALADAMADINASYVANGGKKNITRPVMDLALRSALYSLEGRADEMRYRLIYPAMDAHDQLQDTDPSDGLDYNLTGLDAGEQAALLLSLQQCETKMASEDKTEANAWGFGCTGYLFAYSLALAYEEGLDQKLAEQYPLF